MEINKDNWKSVAAHPENSNKNGGLLYIIRPHEKSSSRELSQSFSVQFHHRMYQVENPLQFNKWPIVTFSNPVIKICRHNIIKW